MTGIPLVIAFIATIVLMIVAISKWKIHPFLAIMGVSLLFALVAGVSLNDIPNAIGAGFSSTFTSIGIVIIFGALIGMLLEKTGAALKMADCVVRLVGKKHPEAAMLLMGWIVSIPVFCDSGFVILTPIKKSLVQRTRKSSVACSVALSMGLYISHCLVPPTPGPIAASNTLFRDGLGMEEVNLLLVIGVGVLCSILPMLAGYLFAILIGKKVKAKDEPTNDEMLSKTYEEMVTAYGKLPGAAASFAPIVVPIVLMGLASAQSMFGKPLVLISFMGTPMVALGVGVILGLFLLIALGKGKELYQITNETLKTVGPILFVTAAGGVLGKVIAASSMVNFIKSHASSLQFMGLFFPFLLSAILRTALGSATVAITTSAGIIAPLMTSLGFVTPQAAALVVVAIGAGAMTVSHANDSYFWVVTNFGEMKPQDGYKTQTLGSLVVGVAAILNVLLVSLFFH